MSASAETLAGLVASDLPGPYRVLMALSSRGGRARASLLTAVGPPYRLDDFEEQVGKLELLGAVSVRRSLPSVLLRDPERRNVVLTRKGEEVADRLWARARTERMERKVRVVGEDSRRVRVLHALRFGRLDADELRVRAGLVSRPEFEAVVSDLVQEEIVFALRTYRDGEHRHVTNVGRTSYGFAVEVTDIGLTGDGFVVGREAARRYLPKEARSTRGGVSPGVQ